MKVTCCRNLRPGDLAEGMAVVVPVAENPSFYASGRVTKLVDRGGTRSFTVVPDVGPEVAGSFTKKQISDDVPSDGVFVECEPQYEDALPVRVVEVVGHSFSVTIDMPGADLADARQRFELAMIGAGLDCRETGVAAYADLPGSAHAAVAKAAATEKAVKAPAKPKAQPVRPEAPAPAKEAVDLSGPVGGASIEEPAAAWSADA